jgi:hypothetical protein
MRLEKLIEYLGDFQAHLRMQLFQLQKNPDRKFPLFLKTVIFITEWKMGAVLVGALEEIWAGQLCLSIRFWKRNGESGKSFAKL